MVLFEHGDMCDFRVKAQGLVSLAVSSNGLAEGIVFGEPFLRSGCCFWWWPECCCCDCFFTPTGSLFYFSLFFIFSSLCASWMSFDILLVQRLGVIGIFAILICSLYKKKVPT